MGKRIDSGELVTGSLIRFTDGVAIAPSGTKAYAKDGILLCECYEVDPDSVKAFTNILPAVRGHWRSRFYYRKSTKAYDCEMHVCSECGSEWSYDAETGSSDFNFCPNCGAEMMKGN